MKIDKYVVMLLLRERDIVSFDEDNYELMDPQWITFTGFGDGGKFMKEQKIIHLDDIKELVSHDIYMKKLREVKLKRLLDE